ncbi:transcriptional regulator [Azospirillum sp. B510]|uniref:helix-turn-helix transcriptional regulator n=1 Tax=Azospirillum sp. (strain B510) TaxID=137722 RepID=UPI0001C4C71B|nr:helix-turn-helix transcriptional regulator [Azospirillum sp. B510]BAI73368.1 transcriptional regulator [Azospirillum sp. B510]
MDAIPANSHAIKPGDTFLLQLYACSSAPSEWHSLMDRVCAEFEVEHALLQEFRVNGKKVETIWQVYDSRTDMERYRNLIRDEGNPRIDARKISAGVGRIVSDYDLFSQDEESVRSQLQERMRLMGYGRFLGGALCLGKDHYMGLSLYRRPDDANDYSGRQIEGLAAKVPHFAQAMQISRVTMNRLAGERLVQSYLERMPCGLIICDNSGHVQWLNQRARSEMAEGRGLQLREGRLHMSHPVVRQKLSDALCRQGECVAPTFLALDIDGCRWELSFDRLDQSSTAGAPLVLIGLSGDRSVRMVPAEALVALFGLTAAEASLASAFVSGLTLEEYAQRRGVGLGTVRFQMKQVLAKTGTNRQADLVRRVLCSAAAQLVVPI